MRFLVVGCGSIGRRHIRNLRELGYTDILAYRSKRSRSDPEENKLDTLSFFELDGALAQRPDAVLITNPTALHIPVALNVARTGCHLFIEKPVSHSMEGVNDLLQLVAAKQLVAMVGYNMRFQPGLTLVYKLLKSGVIGRPVSVRAQVGSYLPDWRPDTDYRQSYSANEDMGGGVILDLSHELDYLMWLFGPVHRVTCVAGTLGDLDISVEDTAEIVLEHSNDVLSSLHVDYLDRSPVRGCRIVGTLGTLVWDYFSDKVSHFSSSTDKWQDHELEPIERNDMYLAELRHFIACVEGRTKPLPSLEEGVRVLRVALAAKEAARSGSRQEVDYAL
jgi:predicted dehydrogenase